MVARADTARPTSPASNQQKKGSVGCTENTEIRCQERKVLRSDEEIAVMLVESKSALGPPSHSLLSTDPSVLT